MTVPDILSVVAFLGCVCIVLGLAGLLGTGGGDANAISEV